MCGIRTHRLPDNDYFNESAVHARYAAAATLRRVTVTATTDHTTLALTREYYRDDERTRARGLHLDALEHLSLEDQAKIMGGNLSRLVTV